MQLSTEIFFFISALGAFNGFLLGFYFLIFRKPNQRSDTYLGLLILALSIRTGKSVFFYFYDNLAQVYLHLGLGACALIGPFLYLYIKSAFYPKQQQTKECLYHIGLSLLVMLALFLRFPYYEHLELWRPYLIPVIYTQWFLYIMASARSFWSSRPKKRVETIVNPQNRSADWWILSVLLGTTLIWGAYVSCGFGSYILGAVLFSFILYLLILLLIFNQKKLALSPESKTKYADKKIDQEAAELLLNKLKTLMQEQELYKNSSLKLSEVAEVLGVLPHRLSQVLNDNLGISFPTYINQYRVEAAQKMLRINEIYSLEGIGYECGFNSKSSFYATFKKLVGTTPAKYKAQNSPGL